MSVGQKCIPVPDWQEIICGHFISPARCFKQGYRSPSLLTVSFLVKFSVCIDGIFLPSVRQYKKGAAIFAGTFCAYYYYYYFAFFFCSPSFSQHQNHYFSFPWSFSLILGIHLHLSVFACLQYSFSFPCHIPHLVLWALIFVLGQSSSPTCRHCPPSPELFLCKGGGEVKGRYYFTLLFIRSPSLEFLFVCLHTLKSSPSFLL